jgi:hypothetical protein
MDPVGNTVTIDGPLFEIFSLLEREDLGPVSLVCKEWNIVINSFFPVDIFKEYFRILRMIDEELKSDENPLKQILEMKLIEQNNPLKNKLDIIRHQENSTLKKFKFVFEKCHKSLFYRQVFLKCKGRHNKEELEKIVIYINELIQKEKNTLKEAHNKAKQKFSKKIIITVSNVLFQNRPEKLRSHPHFNEEEKNASLIEIVGGKVEGYRFTDVKNNLGKYKNQISYLKCFVYLLKDKFVEQKKEDEQGNLKLIKFYRVMPFYDEKENYASLFDSIYKTTANKKLIKEIDMEYFEKISSATNILNKEKEVYNAEEFLKYISIEETLI